MEYLSLSAAAHEIGARAREAHPDHVWWRVQMRSVPFFCHACKTHGRVEAASNVPMDELFYMMWLNHRNRNPKCKKWILALEFKLDKTNVQLEEEEENERCQ
jgi:hypothetical protein